MLLPHLPTRDPGEPDLRSPGRFLLWHARQLRGVLPLAMWWGVVWMAAQAAVPAVLGVGVQAVVDGDLPRVGAAVACLLVLGVVQAGAGVLRHRRAVHLWIAAASRTQQLVARHAARQGAELPRQVGTGEVVAVTASDVEKIGSAFDVLARLGGSVVAFVAVAVILVAASPILGLVVVAGVPLLALAIGPALRPLERREDARRASVGRATDLAADTVAGLRVLRGIGGEDVVLDRFRAASQDVRTAAVRTAEVRSLVDSLQVALPGLLVVLVTWLGARLALAGTIDAGELVAFYAYTAFLVSPLRTLTEAAHKWTAARVGAARVIRLLSVERPDHVPATATAHAVPADGGARLGRGRLHDPETGITIEPDRLTAIVSTDPVAADSLADRLGGYALGSVSVDGVALDAMPHEDRRALILVQDKDPAILSGTLAEFLDVPGSGRMAVATALDAAHTADVLEALAPGTGGDRGLGPALAARITERGRTLSGGQRQRLALARSLVADPPILVLDEPTSAVDAYTEARIGAALKQARTGRTTVLLATSPLLLEHADRVLLLRDGQVVAEGTHRDLLRDHPGYRDAVAREDDA